MQALKQRPLRIWEVVPFSNVQQQSLYSCFPTYVFRQSDAMLAIDAVSLLVRGLASVLAESPDVFRYSYRRGQVFNDVTRSTHCRADPAAPWQYGPTVFQHLRSVGPGTPVLVAIGTDLSRSENNGIRQ